ncbi:MAG: cytochrome c3 family protein [Acidobacteria bacterium]|nr:cytochrome c3 family protein [Acidobacteriota bacterium]
MKKSNKQRTILRWTLFVLLSTACVLIGVSIYTQVGSAQNAPNSCIECHAQLADERLSKPAKLFDHDIHNEKGLTCTDCHGGDSTKSDKAEAKSPMMGYTGKPTPQQIPAFCGKCHSDANLMKRFDPGLRVDQVQEYFTSIHGQRLKGGDTNVATCVSCHGVHGIRPPEDPTSSVYAGNVAETCSQCHSSGDKMGQYGIPTDQYAKYKSSVHANALYNKHDMSAPTCNDCHGNHGAVPPGLDSIANVCGTCHQRQKDLFEKGPHKAPFDQMKIGACIRCHTNHGIQPPSDAMAGVGQGSACTSCHQNDKGFAAAQQIGGGLQKLSDRIADANDLLDRAERAGMEVSKPKFELKEATDSLTQSRVLVHSVSADDVQKDVDAGMTVADKSYFAGESAFAELSFRRKGLAISLFFILFLAGLVYLKVRQIEGRYPFEKPA